MAHALSEKQLRARDAKRDLGAELLAAVRDMKAGRGAVVGRFPETINEHRDVVTKPSPRVIVFAGANGAGKSTHAGAILAKLGVETFVNVIGVRLQLISMQQQVAQKSKLEKPYLLSFY